MKYKLHTLAFLALVLFVSGCSSNLMTKSQLATAENSDPNTVTVVFMRSSFVASAIGVELFEIVDGKLKFVGALPNGSKIAYKTTPGQKVYMAFGDAADFMIANLEKGKTYYSIVRPNWGTGGFAPTPIRNNKTAEVNLQSAQFKQWIKDTTLLEKKPSASEWFAKKEKMYIEIYNDYWSKFQRKSDAEKAERTLLASDGQ